MTNYKKYKMLSLNKSQAVQNIIPKVYESFYFIYTTMEIYYP